MPTILLKKSDTPGSVPGTANLTNLAGGVEVAVNTADKRVYSMTSASAVIELGTNPSSLTCADVSATVFRSASATITNLIATSASITTLTNNPTFGAGTANGVLYLNGSKVATSGTALVFDGTNLGVGTASPTAGYRGQFDGDSAAAAISVGVRNTNTTGVSRLVLGNNIGQARFTFGYTGSTASAPFGASLGYLGTEGSEPVVFQTNGTERMRLDSSGNLSVTSGNLSIASGSVFYLSGSGGNVYLQETGGTLFLGAGGAARVQVISSGNVGIGVTPSAWVTTNGYRAMQIGGVGIYGRDAAANELYLTSNAFNSATGFKYIYTAAATQYAQLSGSHVWYNAASGTAGNAISFTQAMTLTASGQLELTAAAPRLAIAPATGTNNAFVHFNNSASANFSYVGIDNSGGGLGVAYAMALWHGANYPLVFGTNNTERARITAAGNLLVGTTTEKADNNLKVQLNAPSGGQTYFSVNRENDYGVVFGYDRVADKGEVRVVSNTPLVFGTNNTERARITSGGEFVVGATATVNSAITSIVATASTNVLSLKNGNDGNYFLYCANTANAERLRIEGDGDVYNLNGTYGTISDERVKQDIVDAPSQWDDLKAVRFRKYRMKSDVAADPNAPSMLGVVAQELEAVCPGLVDEHTDTDGETTKTVKSSILLMKAAVALQEAMARIEQLEADMAALEAK